jgi:hypothetical protein
MRLIPALDLKDGHCVRLLRGDFDAETRYDADPSALLAKYRGYGADWLHIVDLDGARNGNNGKISARSESSWPSTCGSIPWERRASRSMVGVNNPSFPSGMRSRIMMTTI